MFLRYYLQVFVISSAIALADSVCLWKEEYKAMKEKYKAMKEKFKATNEKKNKFQKKFQDLKKKIDPVTTTSPSVNVVAVSGCYRGGKCNSTHGCCDCEMTQSDCNADPFELGIWIDNCAASICAVPVTT